MKRPAPIAPAVPVSPERTNVQVRRPFIELAHNHYFRACVTLREQVLFIKDFLDEEEWRGLSITNVEIARFLGINSDATVGDIIRRGDNGHEVKGRTPKLDPNDLVVVRGWIENSLRTNKPMTLHEVVNMIRIRLGKETTTNALQKALTKWEIAKTVDATPEDARRLQMDHETVAAYMNTTPGIINNIPASFVYNMDETGINELANAKRKRVLVPHRHTGGTVKYPIERNTSHATLVACIAADGTAIKPLVIIKEVSIRQRLVQEGWTRHKVMFGHSQTGYINKELFMRWLREVFIADVARRRLDFEMPTQRAVLMMDNCSVHIDEAVLEILTANNITAVFIPPHGSYVFQPLDRVMFSSFKARLRSAIPHEVDKQTERLSKILESWEDASKTSTIIGSFKLAGLVYRLLGDNLVVSFDPNNIKIPNGINIPTPNEPLREPPQPVRRPRARGPRIPII